MFTISAYQPSNSIFKTILTSFLLTLFIGGIAKSSESYTQTPLKLKASEVLPAGVVKGLSYHVDEDVTNDGLVNICLCMANW